MRAATLLATLALIAVPATARAQGNPFGGLPQAPPTPTPTVAVPARPAGGGGLAGWQEALIFAAGLVLLAGIGWAIVSDARGRAPVRDAERAHPGTGSQRRNRSRKQRERERARAKAGRAQRRRSGRRR